MTSMLILKNASGLGARGGLIACRMIPKAIVLWFTAAIWLMALLTVIWPFVAIYILLDGSAELQEGMAFNFFCWVFNAIFFASWWLWGDRSAA